MRSSTKKMLAIWACNALVWRCALAAEYLFFANGGNALKDRYNTIIPSTGAWTVAIYKTGSDNDIDGYNAIIAGQADADDVFTGMTACFGSVTNGYFEATFSSEKGNPPSDYGLCAGDKIYARLFDAAAITGASWCAVIDDTPTVVSDFVYPLWAGWRYDPGDVEATDWVRIVRPVAPAAPAGVSASDGLYSDKVRVSWNDSGNASSYKVYRNTISDSAAATLLATVSSTVLNDTATIRNKRYYYWVRAVNAYGQSALSEPDSGWRKGLPAGYSAGSGSQFAVFDSNTGYWYILGMDGTLVAWAVAWGWPGAWPVPGDYNGDGISDLCVFDTNTGFWYALSLEGTVIAWAVPWGWPGAWPVPGDYNNDGVSDLCVFDTNTGYWYALSLNGTVLAWAVPWGWPGAVPVSGAAW